MIKIIRDYATALIRNTSSTYTNTIETTEEVVLPDETITVTDSTGNSTSTTNPVYDDVVINLDILPPVINEYMELVIDTTISGGTPSDSFSFANNGNGLIDWGDGTIEPFDGTTQSIDASNTHQYATAGVYTIRYKGWGRIIYTSNADNKKITELKNAGAEVAWSNISAMFQNCSNMICTATDTIITTTNNGGFMFSDTTLLVTPPKIMTYRITTVQNAFIRTSLNSNLGYMDLRKCGVFNSFALGVTTWSTENYGNTLLGWLRWDSTTHAPAVGWVLQSNQNFHGGSSTLVTGSEAALARDYLINTLGWVITDGGLI